MEALRIHVERIVRPIRASVRRKNTMREELLAHLQLRVQTLSNAGLSAKEAASRAIENLGDPIPLSADLQRAVPIYEQFLHASLPFPRMADAWFDRPKDESRQKFALYRTLFTVLFLTAAFLVLGSLAPFLHFQSIQPKHMPGGKLLTIALIIGSSGLATFIAYWLADAMGIRRSLSRSESAGILRRTIALVVFADFYLALFAGIAVASVWLTVPIDLQSTPVVFAMLAKVWISAGLLFHAAVAPVVAWEMTKEHKQYETWGRLKVEE